MIQKVIDIEGKKMAGHMGNKVRTIQNLEIIKSDFENNLIFVKGSVPGSKNSFVLIRKTSKKINRETTLEKSNKIQAETVKASVKKEDSAKIKTTKDPVLKTENKKTTKKEEEKIQK